MTRFFWLAAGREPAIATSESLFASSRREEALIPRSAASRHPFQKDEATFLVQLVKEGAIPSADKAVGFLAQFP